VRIAILDAGESIMNSAAQALETLGSETQLIPIEVDHQLRLRDERSVVATLEEFRPEVLFVHNLVSLLPEFQEGPNGLEPTASLVHRLVEQEGIRVAAWFLDDPFQSSLHFWLLRKFAGRDRLLMLLLDRTWVERCRAFGVDAVHLPHCTDPAVFADPDRAASTEERLHCAVSVVGASLRSMMIEYKGFLKDFVHRIFGRDEAGRALFEIDSAILFIERTVNADSDEILMSNLSTQFQSVLAGVDEGGRAEFHAPIEWIGSCRQRWRLANLVSDKGLGVFGDDQWPAVLHTPEVFRGPIDYDNELPALYAGEAIHLLVNRIQVRTAVTQRVYDIAAAGGFSLSDHRSDLDLFLPGVVATYSSLKEVPQLVDTYLADPVLRREMGLEAREVVLGAHTYRHRMADLLEHLQAMKSR
jgi:spore maturation protein CgeB